MKLLITLIVIVTIAACSQQVELDENKINSIAIEAQELLDGSPESKFDFDYSSKVTIEKLEPQSVYITKEGLYIVLHSGFTSESGLFVSRVGVYINKDSGQDPQYELLSKNVYRYDIKG